MKLYGLIIWKFVTYLSILTIWRSRSTEPHDHVNNEEKYKFHDVLLDIRLLVKLVKPERCKTNLLSIFQTNKQA